MRLIVRAIAGAARRLYTVTWLHRLVPVAVGLRLADIRGWVWWRRPSARADAEAWMGKLVDGTPREGERTELAHRYVRIGARRHELLFRPWLSRHIDVDDLDRLTAAKAAGRGVVLPIIHIGNYAVVAAVLAHHGVPIQVPAGPFLWEEDPGGYRGAEFRQRKLLLDINGAHTFNARGSFDHLVELLAQRGDVVMNGFDQPGRTVTPFAGQRMMLTTGTARLAFASDSLVVCTYMSREQRVQLMPALDPRDFDSVLDLHNRLAEGFSVPIVDWPEGYDAPLEPAPAGAEQAVAPRG